MINQEKFLNVLSTCGVEFFTGVPDSYLNGFCNYLLETVSTDKNIIAANEGNAVAIASGYYFSTGKVPLVYMQNSGMGNTLNPIISLVDHHVYEVPMVLLIGWRGEPGGKDYQSHVQHRTQGEVTTEILEMLNIPYVIASDDDAELERQTKAIIQAAKTESKPIAIIGCKGVFDGDKKAYVVDDKYPLSREEAIEIVLDTMPKDTIYTVTTGRATRELYFLRERRGEGHQYDFLNLGSMGHASSVALGIALVHKDRKVVCLDGDSAAIMHMGCFTMASKVNVPNMMHIVLNNGAHESVGGQPSAGQLIDFTQIAKASGYNTANGAVTDKNELIATIKRLKDEEKASFIDVRVHKGLKGELPPLKIDSKELIHNFIKELQK